MMIYWHIFLASFIPSILGYGGGPASIPLIKDQVVDNYSWMSVSEFSEMLAVGNALPGPIATKMAAYVGYQQGGILGASVGLFATIAPSLILMLVLVSILLKYKDSIRVKRLTNYIRPAIVVLLGIMTVNFFTESYTSIKLFQTIFIAAVSLILMEKFKIGAGYVIGLSLIYGAIFLG